jgi:hypothetical protein
MRGERRPQDSSTVRERTLARRRRDASSDEAKVLPRARGSADKGGHRIAQEFAKPAFLERDLLAIVDRIPTLSSNEVLADQSDACIAEVR